LDLDFWRDKKVFLTGHTGFKGAWMSLVLERAGAKVTGYALAPEGEQNLFRLLSPGVESLVGDVRSAGDLTAAVKRAAPDIALHMAAQALVRRAYKAPAETYETNVSGTVNLLAAARGVATLVVTSDKVYRNDESGRAFVEADALGGDDPYSASKAAAEMVVEGWRGGFGAPLATVRAGNVIGGGDFSEDRLVPDIYRALVSGKEMAVRYPKAVRPWQHVLDTVCGYLAYAQKLYEGAAPISLNLGPAPEEALTVEEILSRFGGVKWRLEGSGLPEKASLKLNAALAEKALDWKNRLSTEEAVRRTAEWYKAFIAGEDARALCVQELESYL